MTLSRDEVKHLKDLLEWATEQCANTPDDDALYERICNEVKD